MLWRHLPEGVRMLPSPSFRNIWKCNGSMKKENIRRSSTLSRILIFHIHLMDWQAEPCSCIKCQAALFLVKQARLVGCASSGVQTKPWCVFFLGIQPPSFASNKLKLPSQKVAGSWPLGFVMWRAFSFGVWFKKRVPKKLYVGKRKKWTTPAVLTVGVSFLTHGHNFAEVQNLPKRGPSTSTSASSRHGL